ncbi:MAG TPA: WYL domain-containing protein [Microlunatus sp.]|nr:WYL domain-containing protein [Microlunatus sp.]
MIRVLLALADRGDDGISARRLALVAGYPADNESGLAALRRDLRRLRQVGWDIESLGDVGQDGRYVLHARDNRMAVLLSPGEQAALQQALRDFDAVVPSPPAHLADLERAVHRHCLTWFSYRHVRRTVHPHALHNGPSGWMLRGLETESGMVKEFVVDRMADDVMIGQPGTAEAPVSVPRLSFDPMTWEVDPPLEVTLAVTPGFQREVCRVMTGGRVVATCEDEVQVAVVVTNRVAFRSRLLELGLRVQVIGPAEATDRVVTALRAVAEARP